MVVGGEAGEMVLSEGTKREREPCRVLTVLFLQNRYSRQARGLRSRSARAGEDRRVSEAIVIGELMRRAKGRRDADGRATRRETRPLFLIPQRREGEEHTFELILERNLGGRIYP